MKAGYKHTGAGMIPVDWDAKRLDELGTWKGGATPSMQNPMFWSNGNVPWASSGDIKSVLISDTPMKITEAAVKQSSTTLLPPNSVLIVTRSGILRRYLPVSKNTKPIAINQDIKAVIPGVKVDSDYLLHVLVGSGQRILATCLKSGTTVESIEYPWLKAYQVPLPSLPEQQAIAAALSDVDALISGLDQLIAKKRDLKQAAMQQLLTGQTRLPGFSGEWKRVKAGDIGQFRGGSGFPTKVQGATVGTYPLFKVSDMNHVGNEIFMDTANNYISEALRKQLGATAFPAESIVFAKVGAAVFLERKKILIKASCLDNNMAAFVLDAGRAYSRFIHYVLLNTNLGNLVSTTALPSLSKGVLSAIELTLPPLPEQIAIATVISDMDAELAALENRHDKTRALKQGMMQNLLTGRIRLI
ncbi:type I restriction enzyme, S subunit [Collimonas sp. OK242]|nr:type I restriction enzyme, S subunit [Collimonas sp. OK242]